jgi:lysine-N-methylase
MPKQYKLNALNKFTCIGGECPDDCCSGWNIRLDIETYHKWQTLNDDGAREMLMNSITLTKDNESDVIYVNKEENQRCTHLDQENLCTIQRQLGEDLMPKTCRDYPRSHATSGERQVRSALMSCPEIARLVLFENQKDVHKIKGNISSPPGNEMSHEKLVWYLEKASDNILSSKDFPLNIKLTYLARVLAETNIRRENGSLDNDTMKTLTSDYRFHMNKLRNAVRKDKLVTNPTSARHMWNVIVTGLAAYPEFSDKFGVTSSIMELQQLYNDSINDHEQYDPFFNRIQACKQQTQSTMAPYEKAFQKYLQAAFVSNSFPWAPGHHGHTEAFLSSLIPFAVIQLLSWLYAEKQQRLTENDVVTIVYGVDRRFVHRADIIKNIRNNSNFYRLDLYFDWFLNVA